jgi:hypothetical protein
MHLLNAFALIGKDVDLVDLIEGTETCTRYKHDYKKERQLAKAFIHGTNYGGGARTMGIAAGVTTHQAEKFQSLYFGKYPGIKRWHERVEYQLMHKRYGTTLKKQKAYFRKRWHGYHSQRSRVSLIALGLIFMKIYRKFRYYYKFMIH